MPTPQPSRLGRKSLFRGKTRTPVTITLTPAHTDKLDRAVMRLTHALQWQTGDPKRRVTRADVFALLIEHHADAIVLPPEPDAAPTP